jgi:thiamine phosphate synthase YjbQ (UPF0047 family)
MPEEDGYLRDVPPSNGEIEDWRNALDSSATVIIDGGRLIWGTWQGVYFCEFYPPRGRKFFVKIIG